MTLTTVTLVLFAASGGAVMAAAIVVVALRPRLGAIGSERASPAVGPELLARHRDEVRHQLDRVADLVHGLSDRQAAQHGEVSASLAETRRATAGLADTTAHLRHALASPKARGQWGERMADDVLRLAGFVEGVNYRRQVALPGGTVPDVTFWLPGGLVLHMDVKFPLDNYLRATSADSETERTAHTGAFRRDVRRRVQELSGRGYVQPGTTVDHVLLFVPNEAVYGFVHECDPGLADVALRQKVVLCSPFTLFAVLGVIRQSVEAHEVERTADELLECLAGFTHQWQRFADQLDVVARRFDTAHRGLEDLTGPRRRQLDRQLDRLDDLRTRRGLASDDQHGGDEPGDDEHGGDRGGDEHGGEHGSGDRPGNGPRLTPVDRTG